MALPKALNARHYIVDTVGPGMCLRIFFDAKLNGKAKVMAVPRREQTLSTFLERPVVVGEGVVAASVGVHSRVFRRVERKRAAKEVNCCCKAAFAMDVEMRKQAVEVKLMLNGLWAISEEKKKNRKIAYCNR